MIALSSRQVIRLAGPPHPPHEQALIGKWGSSTSISSRGRTRARRLRLHVVAAMPSSSPTHEGGTTMGESVHDVVAIILLLSEHEVYAKSYNRMMPRTRGTSSLMPRSWPPTTERGILVTRVVCCMTLQEILAHALDDDAIMND